MSEKTVSAGPARPMAAGLGEGLQGLVAKWRIDADTMGPCDCADDLEIALEAAARLPIPPGPDSERILCMGCGKSVSTPVPKNTLVRAWVECPECIEKGAALATPSPQAPPDILASLDREKYTGPAGEIMQARLPAATQEQPAGSGPASIRREQEIKDLAAPRKVGEDGALREALCEALDCINDNIDLHGTEWADRPMTQWTSDWRLSLSSPIEPEPTMEQSCEDEHKLAGPVSFADCITNAEDGSGARIRSANDTTGNPLLLLPDNEWSSLSSDSQRKIQKWFEIATEHLEQMLRPTPQASSEIRERVRQERVLVLEDVITRLQERMGNEEYGHAKAAVALDIEAVNEMKDEAERALAPSRQGAAKRVEG